MACLRPHSFIIKVGRQLPPLLLYNCSITKSSLWRLSRLANRVDQDDPFELHPAPVGREQAAGAEVGTKRTRCQTTGPPTTEGPEGGSGGGQGVSLPTSQPCLLTSVSSFC